MKYSNAHKVLSKIYGHIVTLNKLKFKLIEKSLILLLFECFLYLIILIINELNRGKNADIIKKVVERKDRILRRDACENILNNVRIKDNAGKQKGEIIMVKIWSCH